MKTYKGCVYFLKHIGMSAIKIGMSSSDDLKVRISAYKTCSPYGIELLGTIKTNTPHKLEQEIHKKLSAFRVKGEWFEINKDIVTAYINMYSDIEMIEKRNNFEYEINNISKHIECKNIKKVLEVYQIKKSSEYDVLNIKDIMDIFEIENEKVLDFSKKLKDLGFVYNVYSFKNKSKRGFKMYFR